jgi:hypothetical protein
VIAKSTYQVASSAPRWDQVANRRHFIHAAEHWKSTMGTRPERQPHDRHEERTPHNAARMAA